MNHSSDIRRIVLEYAATHAGRTLLLTELATMNKATLHVAIDETIEALRLDLVAYFLGTPSVKVSIHRKWPKDWWQALKHRWYPAWLKYRWPVQYERIDIERTVAWNVCPHIPSQTPSTNGQHIVWLDEQPPVEYL